MRSSTTIDTIIADLSAKGAAYKKPGASAEQSEARRSWFNAAWHIALNGRNMELTDVSCLTLLVVFYDALSALISLIRL